MKVVVWFVIFVDTLNVPEQIDKYLITYSMINKATNRARKQPCWFIKITQTSLRLPPP